VNYLFEQLLPDLKAAGIGDDIIDRIFVENAAEFLTLQPST
jgi:phosphotriesterase-related protein